MCPTDPAPPDLGRGLSPGRGRVKRGERSLPRTTPGVRALLGRGQVLPGPAPDGAISTSVPGARTAQPGRSPRRSSSAAACAWHGRSERRPRTPASSLPAGAAPAATSSRACAARSCASGRSAGSGSCAGAAGRSRRAAGFATGARRGRRRPCCRTGPCRCGSAPFARATAAWGRRPCPRPPLRPAASDESPAAQDDDRRDDDQEDRVLGAHATTLACRLA